MVLTRSSSRMQTRMSSRQSAHTSNVVPLQGSSRQRKKKSTVAKGKNPNVQMKRHPVHLPVASDDCQASTSYSNQPRDLNRVEFDLRKRKDDILKAEEGISAQWELIKQREMELNRTELERDARTALAQLEERFQCPLCYDILAIPYTLTPAECGHTFCAICTLRWFFSRLHRSCGSWHESVDCPICRSLLILTPDATPRTLVTVPFTPNRLASKAIEDLVSKLERNSSTGKSGEKEVAKRNPCRQSSGCGEKRLKSESRTPAPLGQGAGESGNLRDWSIGGDLLEDWQERSRLGRVEMEDIIGRWCNLNASDFVAIKRRLGV